MKAPLWNGALNILGPKILLSTMITPPLALWLGSLIPDALHSQDIFYFRLANALLYLFTGFFVFFKLRRVSIIMALLFSILYSFDPNIKAFAALFVTDFPVTAFLILASVIFWEFLRTKKLKKLKTTAFVYAMAVSSKISALFYMPFLLFNLIFHCRSKDQFVALLKTSLLFFLLGGFLSYLGHWGFIHGWKEVYAFAMSHNGGGHICSMFDKYSIFGFWYYFIVCFIFKTPVLTLGLVLLSFVLLVNKPSIIKRSELILFLVPAAFLFLLLSRATAQVGFRYFLPGVGLLYLGISLVVARFLEKRNKKWQFGFVGLVAAVAFLGDINTLRSDSYLTYFNAMTPSPTRYFNDANNDWNQGVPKHLQSEVAGAKRTEQLFDFLASDKDKETFVVGASELVAFLGPSFSVYFRALKPVKVVAGYEVHKLSKNQAYFLFKNRKPLYWEWSNASLVEANKPVVETESCRTFSRPIGEHFASPPTKDAIIFIETKYHPEIFINNEFVFGKLKPIFLRFKRQSWFSVSNLNKENLLEVKNDHQEKSAYRALILWQECR